MNVKNPLLNTLIKDAIFGIYDTETTGDNVSRKDKPVEIAVVPWNLEKGFLTQPYSWLINPEMPIHPAAIAVHGLVDEDVENSPLYSEIIPEFMSIVNKWTMVAHNNAFDLEMIPELKVSDNLHLDMLRFARQIYKKGDKGHKDQLLTSHKSQELRYWLNIKVDTGDLQAHRAAADILVTGKVFEETLRRCIERTGVETLGDLLDFINAPMLVEKFVFGKFIGQRIEDVLIEEKSKSKNYFHWLLGSVSNGTFNLDSDTIHSIDLYMKKQNMNIAGYMLPKKEKVKDWKDITSMLSKTK